MKETATDSIFANNAGELADQTEITACTTEWYKRMEKELADKFAIDSDVETQYTGRGTVFKKVGAPLFSLRRGPIGGSMVACIYRRLGSRLIELANLIWIGQPFRSWQQTREMHCIIRALEACRPPNVTGRNGGTFGDGMLDTASSMLMFIY